MSQWKSEGVRTIAICLRNKRERDRGGRKRGSVRKSEIEGENQRERERSNKKKLKLTNKFKNNVEWEQLEILHTRQILHTLI